MAVLSSTNSTRTIKFDVLGKTRVMDCEQALSYAMEKKASDPGSLYFTNLVASRALVTVLLKHEVRTSLSGPLYCMDVQAPIKMTTWYDDGPFTADQFIEMMKFPAVESNSDWFKHLNRFKHIELSSSEKKRMDKNS